MSELHQREGQLLRSARQTSVKSSEAMDVWASLRVDHAFTLNSINRRPSALRGRLGTGLAWPNPNRNHDSNCKTDFELVLRDDIYRVPAMDEYDEPCKTQIKCYWIFAHTTAQKDLSDTSSQSSSSALAALPQNSW
ncbi:unnamed protein product [Leuciscus chuanchicus]